MEKNIFNYVRDSVDIVEHIKKYTQLEQRRDKLYGKCPIERRNDHNFVITPNKKVWWCDSCEKMGDILDFIMNMDDLSLVDATKKLIKMYKLQIPDDINDCAITKH